MLDWPGNSPDLNPKENVWNFMKNLPKKKKAITFICVLMEENKKLWVLNSFQEYLKKLFESMHRKLQLVVKHNGEMTTVSIEL